MHILAQWQNLALSICEVYREKKRMHLLDPRAGPRTGGMTFLGRGRAKSSPQLPWRLAHAVLARLSKEAAGRKLSCREDSLLWSKRGQIQPPFWHAVMHFFDHPATESWNWGRRVKIVNWMQGENFSLFIHLLVEILMLLNLITTAWVFYICVINYAKDISKCIDGYSLYSV